MTDSFVPIKTKALETRKEVLIAQYEALNGDYIASLSGDVKLKIKISMNDIEDELRGINEELAELRIDAAQPAPTDDLVVRVVVVAMSKVQAGALDAGEAFAGSPDYRQYDELRSALQAHGIGQLAQYYGAEPDNWSPFIGTPGTTIRTLLDNVVDRLNAEHANQAEWRHVQAPSLSSQCLSDSVGEQIRSWDAFDELGGIVIVDPISLHHPQVRQCLVNAGVMRKGSKSAMIVLSPLKAEALHVNNLLGSQVYQAHLVRAFKYFQEDFDPLYEFGVNDLCNLQRWLYATLPKMSMDGLPPATREAAETSYRPAGVRGPIIGGARR